MKLYRISAGAVVLHQDQLFPLGSRDWDALVRRDDLLDFLRESIRSIKPLSGDALTDLRPLAPIGSQEVWAAGVTYFRSRDARMEESQSAGGGSFYDRVYSAERPELFFKASPHRVVGMDQPVRIRRDSTWNVPEPELTLLISPSARIIGYTIGNDMSSRDIEGENPLYLPQAKTYDGSCALGPCILVTDQMPAKTTRIEMTVTRESKTAFTGATTLNELKRDPQQLVEFLFRETSFPNGCFLMTGTGIVPAGDFTLEPGDVIAISIESIGTLTNTVSR